MTAVGDSNVRTDPPLLSVTNWQTKKKKKYKVSYLQVWSVGKRLGSRNDCNSM